MLIIFHFIYFLSFLASFLGFFGLCLFLGNYSRIFLGFIQHLFELFDDLLLNTFNFIFFYFLVDCFHFLNLPACHQSIDFLCEVSYSDIFRNHRCHICQVRVMTIDLGIFCDVFLEVCLADRWFLLGNDINEEFLFLIFSFIFFNILSSPLIVSIVLLFDLLFDLAEKYRDSLFLLLLLYFHCLATFNVTN